MKRHSGLVGFGLALLLASGAALNLESNKAVAHNGAAVRHNPMLTAD